MRVQVAAQVLLAAEVGPGLTLLHGSELNIGPDGEVDWDADFLAGFDICVASVHSHFEQSRARDDQAVRRAPARTRTSTSSATPPPG